MVNCVMASAKHVSKVNKVAKPPMTEVEPPLQGPPDPDTYGGAKHVSRINRAAQPQSPGHGYTPAMARRGIGPEQFTDVDMMVNPPPMMLRALKQRQHQSPQRFIEAGTHGQDYKLTYGEGELESDFHPHTGVLNRDVDEEQKGYLESETRFWDEVDEDIDARTRARQKAERQGETVSGSETPKFDLSQLDD